MVTVGVTMVYQILKVLAMQNVLICRGRRNLISGMPLSLGLVCLCFFLYQLLPPKDKGKKKRIYSLRIKMIFSHRCASN